MKIIVIIGARSGSKGVKNKNIRDMAGKPLIAWIIGAAKKSKLVDRVIVSTDSTQYARVARKYGAEVPFLRPKSISKDSSTDLEYINHALAWLLDKENYVPDIVIRLVPTAPLQRTRDIDCCIKTLLKDKKSQSCMAVAEASQHPNKALKLPAD